VKFPLMSIAVLLLSLYVKSISTSLYVGDGGGIIGGGSPQVSGAPLLLTTFIEVGATEPTLPDVSIFPKCTSDAPPL